MPQEEARDWSLSPRLSPELQAEEFESTQQPQLLLWRVPSSDSRSLNEAKIVCQALRCFLGQEQPIQVGPQQLDFPREES
jgi:hypothetical protein